jgi:two-component sensor histidine kinase
MDAATISKNGLSIAKDRVNIKKVIARCVAIIKPQVMGRKKLINKVTGKNDSQVYVTGDALRLQQVLTNVVANAVKFTRRGEIKVHIQDCDKHAENLGKEVEPTKKGMILISVSDTGMGIPKDKIATLFDSFNRGDEENVRSIRGTGLGLSLCLKLVKAHGGNFFIESEIGKGSTFSFTVPRNDSKPADNNLQSPSSRRWNSDGVSTGEGSDTVSDNDLRCSSHTFDSGDSGSADTKKLKVSTKQSPRVTQSPLSTKSGNRNLSKSVTPQQRWQKIRQRVVGVATHSDLYGYDFIFFLSLEILCNVVTPIANRDDIVAHIVGMLRSCPWMTIQ